MFIPEINIKTKSGNPKFMIIADAFSEAITNDIIKVGDKLPSHRILSYKMNITIGTATRIYNELERRGLVEPRVGSGTYVKKPTFTSADYYMTNYNDRNVIDFATCQPLNISQSKYLSETLSDISKDPTSSNTLLSYYDTYGIKGHKNTLQTWLYSKFKVNINLNRLLWTYGGQHALSIIVQSLTRPNDKIMVEKLSYPNFFRACQFLERKVIPVDTDSLGIDIDSLELNCRRHRPKLLYLTPSIQNPTCVQINDEKRLKIIEICRRYNILILEDDVLYCPKEYRKTPLASIAPDITIYIGSFSKYFSGGIRLGYIVYPEFTREKLIAGINNNCIHISPLLIDLVCRWLNNGTMLKIDNEISKEISIRRNIFLGIFSESKKQIPGLNFWLTLPMNISGKYFSKKLLEKGIKVLGGEDFCVKKENSINAIRLSLTVRLSHEELHNTLTIIKTEIDKLSI